MFSEIRRRTKKVGQPPGTAIYTGPKSTLEPIITVITYDKQNSNELVVHRLEDCLSMLESATGITWVNVEGLDNVDLVKNLAQCFNLHPLTVEDILNVEQRPKVEEFENYIFITLKVMYLHGKHARFVTKQLSLILGKNFVLSFQQHDTTLFDSIRARLHSAPHQRLREQGSDYLVYRLIDSIIDEYFVVLERIGDEIEIVEDHIISEPTEAHARTIYRLKRQMIQLRKSIWPMREVISHLLHVDDTFVSDFTRLYLRDVYDHTMQAIDTLETFRELLSSLLDMYLSGITNRMNEIMKTLTIIATIFIPITAIASIYGMNFPNMFLLNSQWGSEVVFALMAIMAIGMIIYFRRMKWI